MPDVRPFFCQIEAVETAVWFTEVEFRAVAVMACDDEVLPLQARLENVRDEGDLQEVYDTERQLHMIESAVLRASTWETLIERFAEFKSRPCLRASGPDRRRPRKKAVVHELTRQLTRVRAHLPNTPSDYSLTNIRAICRTCNTARSRMRDDHFRAELQSIARAINDAP